jgi:hypothetical protein
VEISRSSAEEMQAHRLASPRLASHWIEQACPRFEKGEENCHSEEPRHGSNGKTDFRHEGCVTPVIVPQASAADLKLLVKPVMDRSADR